MPVGERLSDVEIDALISRIEFMCGGYSDRLGVLIEPGPHWMVDLANDVFYYDVGRAAALDDLGRRGVTAHEIAHFRYTDARYCGSQDAVGKIYCRTWPKKALVDHPTAARTKNLINLLEDRRIERVFVDEFPGARQAIERLHAGYEAPTVMDIASKAEPAHQFVLALSYCMRGKGINATHPDVIAAVQTVEDDLQEILAASTTKELAKVTFRDDGIWDQLEKLVAAAAVAKEERVTPPAKAMPGPEDEPDSGQTTAEDEDDEDVDALDDPLDAGQEDEEGEDEDDEDESGPAAAPPGSEEGEGAPEPEDEPEPKLDEDEAAPPGLDFEEAEEGGESEDPNPPPGFDPHGDSTPEDDLDQSTPGGLNQEGEDNELRPGMPTPEDLAAMPDDDRERLNDLLIHAAPQDQDEEEAADAVKSGLNDATRRSDAVKKSVNEALARREQHPDDFKHNLQDDVDRYDSAVTRVLDQARTLGRYLDRILHENRFDRWSAIGYDHGKRVNVKRIATIPAGERRPFQRKNRPRNRQYAVAAVCDLSSSMEVKYPDGTTRMDHAIDATVMTVEALELCAGIEYAVYGFSSLGGHYNSDGERVTNPNATAAFKPFNLPLKARAGKVGAMGEGNALVGGGTDLAPALLRVASDINDRYDDTWQKLLIVYTDGEPNDSHLIRGITTDLRRRHNITCIGVGIEVKGQLPNLFPIWVHVPRVSQLPEALRGVLRRMVVKG